MDINKSLANIVTIKEIVPIEDKDRIVLLRFEENGYDIIGQKYKTDNSEFKVGDNLIFVRSGVYLPVRPEFEFLRSRCYSKQQNGFSIKNMKMAGHISQGITFDISILKEEYPSGTNVTKELGIWERILTEESVMSRPPKNWLEKLIFPIIAKLKMSLQPKTLRTFEFPSYLISKSDEDNIQTLKSKFYENHKKILSYGSLKMDGMSGTFLIKDGELMICSRNNMYINRSEIKSIKHHVQVANQLNIKEKLLNGNSHLILQGEVCGPSIQGNIYELKETKLYLYTIKDSITGKLLDYDSFIAKAKELEIDTVEILYSNILLEDYLTEYSSDAFDALVMPLKFTTPSGKVKPSEGIVIRGMDNEFSFKIKNPLFDN